MRIRVIVLATGLVLVLASLATRLGAARLPGDHQGYAPAQPIAFSHRLHAGEMGLDCLYCHSGAERSRHAGVPPVALCMNCHKFVSAPIVDVRAEERRAAEENRKPRDVLSPEIAKIRAAYESGEPVRWTQVHRVPDFVYFDHRRHVVAGVACAQCHGPVETMERVRQVETLSMGWCLDCHRAGLVPDPLGNPLRATSDCAACHY